MLRFLRLPRRIPVRLPARQAGQKWLAAFVISAAATIIAIGWRHTSVISRPLGDFEDLLYDSTYRTRADESQRTSDVVIVAIDQPSLTKLNNAAIDNQKVGWPWPRELYGDMVEYLDKCGARVIAFDILFSEIDRNADKGTDQTFADLVMAAKVPVVFGTVVSQDGKPGEFAPPVKSPIFGAVNAEGGVLRTYRPFWYGVPSLGYRAATLFSGSEPPRKTEFLAHFYGPHRNAQGETTFRYVSAFELLAATRGAAKDVGLDPDVFRDKIVLIGGTAPGLFDAKSIPLINEDPGVSLRERKLYPGVEWQATGIENVLFQQRVHVVHPLLAGLVTILGSFSAAAGSLLPRRTWVKVAWALGTTVTTWGLAVVLFHGETIYWLPLAAPLTALLLATMAAFAWSYFTEGRQRQFISRAFALSTSPVIAEAISENPEKLKLGGERREITVMFTDLAGFTDISETMEVVKLAQVINIYMEAMSEEIVTRDGYLDKYIGDAIMSFWNGLVDQSDHAARACRSALAIKRREVEIAPDLQKLVDAKIITRIGVNTGPMAVGNLGSSRKLAYTVLGDAVNLGARLEPANKLYDTEVIISQATAEHLNRQFVIRELDLLAVKGKTIPMAVYELIAEGPPTSDVKAKLDLYADGLRHYRAQRWDDAEASWTRLLKDFPNDGPAHKMLARVAKLRHESLPPDWDGVYRSKEK
jgi:adenylate cyclase